MSEKGLDNTKVIGDQLPDNINKIKKQDENDWNKPHLRNVVSKVFEDRFKDGLSTKSAEWRGKGCSSINYSNPACFLPRIYI